MTVECGFANGCRQWVLTTTELRQEITVSLLGLIVPINTIMTLNTAIHYLVVYILQVDAGSRLRLALDLAMNNYNMHKYRIIQKSVENMKYSNELEDVQSS